MATSEIEWTEATWNPIAGCSMVSPGCTNCYAMRMAARLEAMGTSKYIGTTRRSGGRAVWSGKIRFDEKALQAPLSWKKPRRIFVNSMSDLFHEAVSDDKIRQVWEIMSNSNWHEFQVLTKRPERARELLTTGLLTPLSCVWLGVSVESTEFLSRIEHLRETPAAVRFVSFEPLLGSVASAKLDGVDWAIVGGESGPSSRPIERNWVQEIKDLCSQFGVAFFFKQWGGTNKKRTGRNLYGRTWDEYPRRKIIDAYLGSDQT